MLGDLLFIGTLIVGASFLAPQFTEHFMAGSTKNDAMMSCPSPSSDRTAGSSDESSKRQEDPRS